MVGVKVFDCRPRFCPTQGHAVGLTCFNGVTNIEIGRRSVLESCVNPDIHLTYKHIAQLPAQVEALCAKHGVKVSPHADLSQMLDMCKDIDKKIASLGGSSYWKCVVPRGFCLPLLSVLMKSNSGSRLIGSHRAC